MIVDLLPEIVWKNKIKTRQRRLNNFTNDSNLSLNSLDEYLLLGNNIALEYFENNRNVFKKLWEYHGLNPKCGSHSTYTYAAFLSLTEEHNKTELQKNVRWVGGIYGSKRGSGHHGWIEKKENVEWEVFETIPEMRIIPAGYLPWYTFQISQNKSKVTSEEPSGMLAISIYGFINS